MTAKVFNKLWLVATNTARRFSSRRSAVAVALMLGCVVFAVRAHNESWNGYRERVRVAGFNVSASTSSREAWISGASTKPAPPTTQAGPGIGIRAVYFRITPRGIDPAKLTLPPGRYLVAIDNDSGFNAADVRITQSSGPQLQRAQMPPGVRKWRGYVDFTPGTFVLTDPGNPKRVCKLKITDP